MNIAVYSPADLDERRIVELTGIYAGLIEVVGWEPRHALAAALSRSLLIAVASLNGEAIGATRVVGDGIYNAILYDLVVSPEHRGKGIGQALVHACLQRIRTRDLTCIADPSASGFYRATGWSPVEGFILSRDQ